MALDFGIFYEIAVPEGKTSQEIFHQTIHQVKKAEEVGFSHFWSVEHHFLGEFSHSSAPEAFFGAIAAHTKTIRIGHGVRLLPYPYNHPIRVAEMAATLDNICDGRLEFGTGRSVSRIELEGFGIDPSMTRELWRESLEMVVGAWTEKAFSWEGKHFKFPLREVVPKPVQAPHPPLWIAATGPESHQIAGLQGLGLLSFTLMVGPDELKKRIAKYRIAQNSAEAKPIGKFANKKAAAFTLVLCAETDKKAREIAGEACVWYVRESFKLVASVALSEMGEAVTDSNTYDYVKGMLGIDPDKINYNDLIEQSMIVVGSPETCIKKVTQYQDAGIDQYMSMMQVRDVPHQAIMDSIDLFGKQVIPYFQ